MGFAISWFAIPQANSSAFFSRYGLSLSGEKSEVPDYLISTANLDTGWTLVWYNQYGCSFLGDRELAKVSQRYDIVRCLIEEHVMASSAELWSGGSRKWLLSHEGENGPKGLDSIGELPDVFQSIRGAMEAKQLAEGGDAADVDYLFEIPLLVAKSLVGFKHDEVSPHMSEGLFHEMSRPEQKVGFWTRLLGKK